MAVMLHNEAVAEVIVISEYVHDNGLIFGAQKQSDYFGYIVQASLIKNCMEGKNRCIATNQTLVFMGLWNKTR